MNMDEDYQKQFDCVGSYFDARKIRDFISVLNLALEQSMAKTTVTVELLDQELQPTETNVTVSFLNHLTREPVYEFVHYRDKNNITDTLEIEPILTYDVIANTIPPVERKRVDIIGGRHNEIKLETPQGFLNITMRDYMKYENGVHALIKKPGTKEVIHVQGVPNTEKYLTGIYDVEVLTLPKTLFKNVEVTHQKTTKLSLADPGLVNFISSSYIFATIFQIQGKKESWVTNLDTKNTTTTLAMQPGDYKIALRTKDTYGSKFTEIKYFKVNSRQSTSIKFFD
jgi:Ca-activated chloride channel family protein